jgi:serine phosphatase RsbU (regulator of sigma subunit)
VPSSSRRDSVAAAGLGKHLSGTRRRRPSVGVVSGGGLRRTRRAARPGDSVLFASDGPHEWRNREGIALGDEQIGEIWLQCQSKSASESIDHMFGSIHEFSQGGGRTTTLSGFAIWTK